MNYLLDTHTFIWAVTEEENLSKKVRTVVEDGQNAIYVSAISFWEIALKFSYGKLDIFGSPADLMEAAIKIGFKTIPISETECSTYHLLDATWHRDPFDRMLIWQALRQNLTLITKDSDIEKYKSVGLKTLW